MAKKSSAKSPRITERRQDKRFYLLDWYKYAMGQIIANHRKLSPGAKGFGHALLALFGTKPWFPMNMRELARHCGVSERAARNYRHELEAAKLFRFAVPPYWARKNKAKATEIHFRTGTVTKWLRNHGLLKAKSDWVSRNDKPEAPSTNTDEMGTTSLSPALNADGDVGNPCGSERTPLTTGKMSSSLPYSKEGGAKPAAPSLMARDAADAPPKENSQKKGLGADFNGEWHRATQVEKPDWSDFELDDDVRWPDVDADGFVIGFGVTGSSTEGCVLVSWFDDHSPDLWVETAELERAETEAAEPEPEPAMPTLEPMYGFEVGDRVSYGNRPIGTVTGFYACVGAVVDFGNGHETVAPGSLELVPRAEVDTGTCRAGTRVRHLKYGDGTCTAIDGTKVTVLFDRYDERKILLAFLQIVDNELAGDILASAVRVRTEQITG